MVQDSVRVARDTGAPRPFRSNFRNAVVSGEKSETLSVYEIDGTSGALKPLQKYPTGKGSNWVEIVSFD